MAAVLSSLSLLKTHLEINDKTQDGLLTQLLDEVEECLAGELQRGHAPGSHPLVSVSSTEYYDGPGREQLLLRRRPVTVVTRVCVDATGYYNKGASAFPVANDYTEGVDFVASSYESDESNPGILIALGSIDFADPRTWKSGRGNILVTYTAGYSTIPKDIVLCVNQLCAATWSAADLGLGGPIMEGRMGQQAFKLLREGSGPDAVMCRNIIGRYSA